MNVQDRLAHIMTGHDSTERRDYLNGIVLFSIFMAITVVLVYFDDTPSMWRFPLLTLVVIVCAVGFAYIAR